MPRYLSSSIGYYTAAGKVEMSTKNYDNHSGTRFQDQRKANEEWGIDRSEEKKGKILAWIQNVLATHPEGLFNNTFMLPSPTIEPIKMDEEEFPALPSAPKTTLPTHGLPFNYATLKFTSPPKSPFKQTPTSKKRIKEKDAATLQEKNNTGKNSDRECSTNLSGHAESKSPPPAPWSLPQSGQALSTTELQGLASDSIKVNNLTPMKLLINPEILGSPHGPWKECRCDQCYEEHKEDYEKHMEDCEDCREEYFNHALFDGKLQSFWVRLERKLGSGEEICKLCRWKRDLVKHPFERPKSSSST